MSNEQRSARALTRSLMLGLSIGTVSVVQVGCTPTQSVQVSSGSVATLCQRALQTRQVGDLEALLRSAPRADCVGPTLAAMPRSTLVQVSPRLLAALPASVRSQLPTEVKNQINRYQIAETERNTDRGY
jgi:hypothetical protein